MSTWHQEIVVSSLIGFTAGLFLSALACMIHHRVAAMDYGDGQVLMLLMDTYPEETKEARDALLGCLKDGYISQSEHDYILKKATGAVFYENADFRLIP